MLSDQLTVQVAPRPFTRCKIPPTDQELPNALNPPTRGHGELSNHRQRDKDDHSYAPPAPTATTPSRLRRRYIRPG
ncbi:hypothetical protein H9L39_11920 [Fusarium oxysporum f. sp. albedinis]|nr:hypothetical protein H9L39_11920 [Fusarium oxysporum f. sp. albedinis]